MSYLFFWYTIPQTKAQHWSFHPYLCNVYIVHWVFCEWKSFSSVNEQRKYALVENVSLWHNLVYHTTSESSLFVALSRRSGYPIQCEFRDSYNSKNWLVLSCGAISSLNTRLDRYSVCNKPHVFWYIIQSFQDLFSVIDAVFSQDGLNHW